MIRIVPLEQHHYAAVQQIHAAGIATGHATFEFEPARWEDFSVAREEGLRFVALDGDAHDLLGWAAASRISDRCAYRGVLEVSIYVFPASGGRGVGAALLAHLVEASEAKGFWSLQAGIFPENVASLRLHEAAGFQRVGTRTRVGRMTYGPLAGTWRDVVLLERRSHTIGID